MKHIVILSLVIITILFTAGCVKKDRVARIRFGIIKPSINHLPLAYAMQRGFLSDKKIKIIEFTSGWELQEAIAANKVDIAIMPFTFAWTSVAKGYKLKILSCFERETDGILTFNRYTKLTDLQDKKIGLLRASTLDILMQDLAKRHGITYVPVYFRTPTEMTAALNSYQVDAIVSYVPVIQKMGQDFHVLHWFAQDYPGHPCCDLVATDNIILSRKKDVIYLMKSLKRSISEFDHDKETLTVMLNEMYGLNKAQSNEAFEHTRFDVSCSKEDMAFERKMMESFLENNYLNKLPANEEVFFAW